MEYIDRCFVVTGAAGFIGSELIRYLNTCGYKNIIAVDSLGNGDKFLNLCDLQINRYFEKEEFLSKIQEHALEAYNIAGIFHLGACSSTTEKDVHYLVENNYRYSQKIAQWAMRRNIRFIYASSAATYGDGEQGYNDQTQPDMLRPLNGYGFSKNLFDSWIYANNLQDQVVGVKFFNVYGAHEEHKGSMRSFINKLFYTVMNNISREHSLDYILTRLQKLAPETTSELGLDDNLYNQFVASAKDRLNHLKIEIFQSDVADIADGEQKRDFVYIKDIVQRLEAVMSEEYVFLRSKGLLNMGTGEARSFNELVQIVCRTLFLPCNIHYIEVPLALQGKYQYYTQAHMSKAEGMLDLMEGKHTKGYFKPIMLEEGIRDYIYTYLLPKYHANATMNTKGAIKQYVDLITPKSYLSK